MKIGKTTEKKVEIDWEKEHERQRRKEWDKQNGWERKSGGKSEKITAKIFNRKTTKIPNNSDALM